MRNKLSDVFAQINYNRKEFDYLRKQNFNTYAGWREDMIYRFMLIRAEQKRQITFPPKHEYESFTDILVNIDYLLC